MSNKHQKNLIEQNLQAVIINHQSKILNEIFRSPEMYSVLMESKQKIYPQKFLEILSETLMENEEFVRQNYLLLSKEILSEEDQKIVLNNILEWRQIIPWVINKFKNIPKVATKIKDYFSKTPEIPVLPPEKATGYDDEITGWYDRFMRDPANRDRWGEINDFGEIVTKSPPPNS